SLFLRTPRPPTSTLFPYTTLFRSQLGELGDNEALVVDGNRRQRRASGAERRPGQRIAGILDGDDVAGANQHAGDEVERALAAARSEEHTSELQSLTNLVCRLLLEK